MHWIVFALLTAVSYGAYNFCIKLSSSHINQIVGAVILQFVALLGGVVCLVYLKIKNEPLLVTPIGIRYAIYAGIFVGLAEILSFYYLSLGISASRGIPLIISGSVFVSTFLGLVILRESFSLVDWLGLLLIAGGIILLTIRETSVS